ncbi:hypothetical protein [Campylobacter sp. MIT 99-7217]|uniref:hypothetical protein n=1 Tax=Campylobacter sp. MIT 99-7217 TaxID=535091 RepID=UPI0021AE970B|nr:hypothetical protein [Campylobacter sp. MIT 99-7217]
MLFSSAVFIFAFLPIMLFGFYLLKHFKKFILAKVFLVLGSFFFYGYFEFKLVFLLLASVLVNYFLALKLLSNMNLRGSQGGGAC